MGKAGKAAATRTALENGDTIGWDNGLTPYMVRLPQERSALSARVCDLTAGRSSGSTHGVPWQGSEHVLSWASAGMPLLSSIPFCLCVSASYVGLVAPQAIAL